MRLEDKQEQLSLAVLHATCAKAGFAFKVTDRICDNWGWDAEAHVFEELAPESILKDFKIKFQLKATRQALTLNEGRYSFSIETPQYDRLRAEAGYDAPTYLVLFQMPDLEEEWFQCTADQLVLKRCLRWVSLRSAPETSQKSITVYFPQAHVLTPEALRKIAKARSLDQTIEYNADGVPHVDYA